MTHRLILHWIKHELLGFPATHTNGALHQKIDDETTRLSGAVLDLSIEVGAAKKTRAQTNAEMHKLLDETLRALNVEPPE